MRIFYDLIDTAIDAISVAMAGLVDAYLKPMAMRVYSNAATPADESDATKIARWLRKNRRERINTRELRRTAGIPGLREAKPTNAAAEMLEELAWLRRIDAPTGGRNSHDYWVNPLIYVEEPCAKSAESEEGANGSVVVSASGTFATAEEAAPKVKTKRTAVAP
jgi:hypothetical protein